MPDLDPERRRRRSDLGKAARAVVYLHLTLIAADHDALERITGLGDKASSLTLSMVTA